MDVGGKASQLVGLCRRRCIIEEFCDSVYHDLGGFFMFRGKHINSKQLQASMVVEAIFEHAMSKELSEHVQSTCRNSSRKNSSILASFLISRTAARYSLSGMKSFALLRRRRWL